MTLAWEDRRANKCLTKKEAASLPKPPRTHPCKNTWLVPSWKARQVVDLKARSAQKLSSPNLKCKWETVPLSLPPRFKTVADQPIDINHLMRRLLIGGPIHGWSPKLPIATLIPYSEASWSINTHGVSSTRTLRAMSSCAVSRSCNSCRSNKLDRLHLRIAANTALWSKLLAHWASMKATGRPIGQ